MNPINRDLLISSVIGCFLGLLAILVLQLSSPEKPVEVVEIRAEQPFVLGLPDDPAEYLERCDADDNCSWEVLKNYCRRNDEHA